MVEVVTGLRMVAQHLVKVTPPAMHCLMYRWLFCTKLIVYSFPIPLTNMHICKAVMERNCEGLEQKTVPQFMLMLYGHDKESEDVLKEIGICSTSHSQLVSLVKLSLPSLLYCLQLFASWVRDGVYDFAALPLGLKSHLCNQDSQSIERIPLKWTGW